ncbi:MAG: hypothetical protein GY746_10375 [Gammaproteobacteria bacterium]|nr:hypothetical protein [Gammaproteobacteria bacterium]
MQTLKKAYSVQFDESKSGFKCLEHTHSSTLTLWNLLVKYQEIDNDDGKELTRQEEVYESDNHHTHQSNDPHDNENISETPDPSVKEYNTNGSINSQYVSESGHSQYSAPEEEEWVPSGNEQTTCGNKRILQLEEDNSKPGPHRGTRVRQQFNPNQMPSGTLEMEKLAKQIESDSASSDDQGYNSSIGEPGQTDKFALCVALTMNKELPRTWKQAT